MPSGDWVANGFIGLLSAGDKAPLLEKEVEAMWKSPKLPGMDEQTAKQYVSFVNFYIHQVNYMRHMLGEPYKVTYTEPSGVLLAPQGQGILVPAGNAEFFGHVLSGDPHVVTIENIQKTIMDHSVHQGSVIHPVPPARPGNIVRGLAHGLKAAGHDHFHIFCHFVFLVEKLESLGEPA